MISSARSTQPAGGWPPNLAASDLSGVPTQYTKQGLRRREKRHLQNRVNHSLCSLPHRSRLLGLAIIATTITTVARLTTDMAIIDPCMVATTGITDLTGAIAIITATVTCIGSIVIGDQRRIGRADTRIGAIGRGAD